MNDTAVLLSDLEKLLRNPFCLDCGDCHWCGRWQKDGHAEDCEWVRINNKLVSLMAMP